MKAPALLLIVVGLLLGPAYYYFCEHLSGETAETHVLTERNNRWELPDGAIIRLKSGLAYKPVALDLTPDNNRHRLRFTFDMMPRESIPSGVHNSYQVSLLQGDLGVLERNLEIAGSGAETAALPAFDILYPGSYVLLLEEVGTPPLGVSGVKLEVIAKAEKPRMWVAFSGLVLMAAGIIVVLRDMLRRSRT
jgi:hypothetical protein